MGDISELSTIVFIGSFIGCLVLLLNFMPPQFLVSSYEGRTIEAEDYFEVIDLYAFANVFTHRMNQTSLELQVWYPYEVHGEQVVDDDTGEFLGNHNFKIYYAPPNKTNHVIFFRHWWTEWIIFNPNHGMSFINNQGITRGEVLTDSIIETDWSEENAPYTLQCNHFQTSIFFGYNVTQYSSVVEAWDNGDLNILIGINFDQVGSGYSAWDLIGKILFFHLPNIHWVVNAFLAIPLWLAFSYIVFILILRAIGAVFGGGGA